MIAPVTLVFHADGRLYFATQAPESRWPSEVEKLEDAGRVVVHIDVTVPLAGESDGPAVRIADINHVRRYA